MIHMKLSDLQKSLVNSVISQDVTFTGISKDTRSIQPGNLYVAIKGEKFDGHGFIAQAFEKGAAAALVSEHVAHCAIPQLICDDTLDALGKIGALWRQQFSLPIIGITGSNGKTTLKNMLASILSAASQPEEVLATEGNLNNNIGVPLMLAQLDKKHRFAVIEMGMNHFGEIAYLTQLVKPTVAVVNNAGAAHIENVGSLSGVAKAKGEIFSGLNKEGIAVLNREDNFYEYWKDLTKIHKQISFGLHENATVTASISTASTFTIHTPKGDIKIKLSLLGRHNVMNALAATAASIALNIDLQAIKKGLETIKATPGRLTQYELSNHNILIDDSYNANPTSVAAAINTLATLEGKKILILGDMKELGPEAKDLHMKIGQKARETGIHYLFTYGELTKATSQAFGKNAFHFTDQQELVEEVKNYITEHTNILVKGSRSMHMEKIVASLLPENQYVEHSH